MKADIAAKSEEQEVTTIIDVQGYGHQNKTPPVGHVRTIRCNT
jgi:hypothetical protein